MFVSKNVCPPSILYWNGLTPEDTTIEIKPSSVSSELVFVMLTSAVISHPFSPKQNVSCVKLSKTPSFSKIIFPFESSIKKSPSPYPQQIPSPNESKKSKVKHDS